MLIALLFFKRAATLTANKSRKGGGEGGERGRKGSDGEEGERRCAALEHDLVRVWDASSRGDVVLIEESGEFDIPHAEWDPPRIPSGSLNIASTVDSGGLWRRRRQKRRMRMVMG